MAEKIGIGQEPHLRKDGFNGSGDFKPNWVCLAKLVQNYIGESLEKQSALVRCAVWQNLGQNCFSVIVSCHRSVLLSKYQLSCISIIPLARIHFWLCITTELIVNS